MNKRFNVQRTFCSVAGILTLVVVGCAVPSARSTSGLAGAGSTTTVTPAPTASPLARPAMPRPAEAAIPSPAQAAMPNSSNPAVGQVGDIAPVAHVAPAQTTANPAQPPANPAQPPANPAANVAPPSNVAHPSSVAPVGHFMPARLLSPKGGCGCGSAACGNSACCPTQGYAICTPQGWNAYGIDPQEFLCDGGDWHPEARLRYNGSIAGLQPEDTVVHYTTEAGDIEFQASNRACLYAPRFTSVRKITGAVAGGRAIGLSGVDRPIGPIRVEHDLPGLVVTDSVELAHADVSRRIDAMRERNRGVPVEGVMQLEQTADVMAALAALKLYDLGVVQEDQLALIERLALAAVPWTIDESLEVVVEDLRAPTLTRDEHVEALTVYDFPDAGRLRIVKMADRADALPGEIVTFVIRIDNVGDSAVNQVVLTDNLTTRLEYVPDSQSCEGVKAEFLAEPNDGQSERLEWKFTEPLDVGDSVTIRFQCKVR